MKKATILLTILCLALLFAGCVPQEAPQEHTHTLIHNEAKEPTCVNNGIKEHWYCPACNARFSDAGATTEVTFADLEVEEKGHTYATELTSTEAGHYYACICHPEAIEILPHKDENTDYVCDECTFAADASTYTLTVTDDSGNVMAGVEVKLHTASISRTLVTDENGKVSGIFLNAETVLAEVLSAPENYLIDAQAITFEGTEATAQLTKIATFTVQLLDMDEKGVSGVKIILHDSWTTVFTDENGVFKVQMPEKDLGDTPEMFFFIPEAPEGYALADAPVNSTLRVQKNETYKIHVAPAVRYTITAVNTLGEPVPYALVDNKTLGVTDKCDENGILVLDLVAGTYEFSASHDNPFYTIDEDSATFTLTAENTNATLVFNESTDQWHSFDIYVTYEDGTPVEAFSAHIYVYQEGSTNTHGLLQVVNGGFACTNAKDNVPYIYLAIDKDGNYGYGYYEKGKSTTTYITIKRGDLLGKSEAHPVPINTVIELPFVDSTQYVYSPERSLKAGESLYISVPAPLGRTVTINGNNFTVQYQGQEILPDENGVVSLLFTDVANVNRAEFKITAKVDATEDLAISAPGTVDQPHYCNVDSASGNSIALTMYQPGQEVYINAYASSAEAEWTVTTEGAAVTIEDFPQGIMPAETCYLIKVIANEAGEVTITFGTKTAA